MLTISLDEYGRFENTHPGRCMIAGVVYEDAAGTGRTAELNRIQSFLQKACADCNVRYPQDLHYERSGNRILNKGACDRVKDHIAGIFGDFIRNARGTYYIYAVVSERRGISLFADPAASNLLRDDFGGNKYLHMTQMAVRNLVVNNPVVQDTNYHLELATRVLNVGNDMILRSQTEQLGMSRPIGANNTRAQGPGACWPMPRRREAWMPPWPWPPAPTTATARPKALRPLAGFWIRPPAPRRVA